MLNRREGESKLAAADPKLEETHDKHKIIVRLDDGPSLLRKKEKYEDIVIKLSKMHNVKDLGNAVAKTLDDNAVAFEPTYEQYIESQLGEQAVKARQYPVNNEKIGMPQNLQAHFDSLS